MRIRVYVMAFVAVVWLAGEPTGEEWRDPEQPVPVFLCNGDGDPLMPWEGDCSGGQTYGLYRGDLRAGLASMAPEPGSCEIPRTRVGIPLGPGGAAAGDDGPLFSLTYVHDGKRARSCAVVDAFDDGDLDFRIAPGGGIYSIRNDGNGSFAEYDARSISNRTGWGAHDFDGDGLIAVYQSTSAFGLRHDWNQIRRGLAAGGFGPNVIDEILDPPIPDFWHKTADGPNGCVGEWSNKQFKGAIARDLDRDGKVDIVAAAYADLGYQDDRCLNYARQWVEDQDRGIFILHNISTPGAIRFHEVALEAIGPDAYGNTRSNWNPYQATPIDYDRDGDLDLFVGATIRSPLGVIEDTPAVRFFENVSTPGTISFVDRTVDVGLEYLNDPDLAVRDVRGAVSRREVDERTRRFWTTLLGEEDQRASPSDPS